MNKSKTHIQVKNNSGYSVNANILVGENGSYSSGDILDANAVEESIKLSQEQLPTLTEFQNLSQQVNNIQSLIDADSEDIDSAIDKFEEIVSFLDNIEPGSELYNIIVSHIDGGNSKVVKHIEVLTQEQYNALETKDPNTEYNII